MWRPAFRNLKYFCWLRSLVLWDLACGFYIEVTSNPLISFITRLYCLSIAVALPTIGIIRYLNGITSAKFFYVYTLPGFIESCILAVSSHITKQEYYFRFSANMKTIDSLLGIKNNTNKSNLIRMLMVDTGLNVLIIGTLPVMSDEYDWVYILCGIVSMTHHQMGSSIVNLMWSRMKLLREVTVHKLQTHQHARHVHHKFTAVKKFMHVYKNLLDAVDHMGTFQAIQLPMLLYVMLCILPQSFDFSLALIGMKTQEFSVAIVVMVTGHVATAAVGFAPVFLAECVYAECDHVTAALADQILLSADEPQYRRLVVKALQYVKKRRPERALGGALPFNSRLPLRLIALVTTFSILLLQFNIAL